MNWSKKRSVVVPIDFSDKSFAALDTALELVDDPAHVHIVHVLQDLSAVEPGEIWDTIDNQTRVDHVKKAVAERLTDAKYKGLSTDVVFGDPGTEIAEFSKSVDAEVIVLPSHGRTGLTRLLIGSVAERVVRVAHCPVLVLRD